MECAQTADLSDVEFLRQLLRRATRQRIPLGGSIDLTHRCNLRCVHCYVGPQRPSRKLQRLEMTTEQVMAVIDEVTAAGCLSLLITGGEPLLREDFAEIYQHAKTNGLLVVVFTNGTLITDQIVELFSDLPPRQVEITLYGATAATHERITGVRGSYRRCLTGIERLLGHGVNVGLKTILMTLNRHEFFDIEHLAEAYGARFRFDAAIFPRLDGDKTPDLLRVSPEEVVEKDFADEGQLQKWREFYERVQRMPVPDTLYSCGAGLTNFHVDPYGNLQPCLMSTDCKYNLLDGDFQTGWREAMLRFRQRTVNGDFVCNQCNKRALCGFCPAFFRLETGAEDRPSQFLCSLGQLRYEAIQNAPIARREDGVPS